MFEYLILYCREGKHERTSEAVIETGDNLFRKRIVKHVKIRTLAYRSTLAFVDRSPISNPALASSQPLRIFRSE